ncbi:ATP-binding protein [Ectobacillus funiculus]|uniref:ATP-binding protein n=1 Tax=Ectobacillus funiculus TaxID=137993 RepID=UPI00101CFABD|nr:AAA family ATPase [Ectobacillus funiculus]
MKIEMLHIYGYGRLENREYTLSQLSVLYGENEAGKSTIRSFIKSVLFGFPTRGQYRYEPRTGGRYGGALTLQTNQYGRIKIERLPKTAVGEVTIYLEDGTRGGEELLEAILQGMDSTLFDSIFSFDVHGLQNIHTVSREELGSYLFSAGAIGTDAILQLEKKLDSGMEALFKPNGRKPLVNAALQEASKLKEELERWQHKLDTYKDWASKKRSSEEQLTELQLEQEQLRLAIRDYETMTTLQPLQLEKKKYESFLSSVAASSFPVNGINRYERLMEEWKAIRLRLQTLRKKIEDTEQTIESFSTRQHILEQEAVVEACRLGYMSYETAKRDVLSLQTELARLEEEKQELRTSIGFSGDALLFHASLSAKEGVMEAAQAFKRLTEQKQQLDEQFAAAKELLEQLEEQVRYVAGSLLSATERMQCEKLLENEAFTEAAASTHMLHLLKEKQGRQAEEELIRRKKRNVLFYSLLSVNSIVLAASLFLNVKLVLFACLFAFVCIVLFFTVGSNKQQSLALELEKDLAALQGMGRSEETIQAKHRLHMDDERKQQLEREQFKLQQAERAYERIVSQYEEWEKNMYVLQKEVQAWKEKTGLPSALPAAQLIPAFERLEKLQQGERETIKRKERIGLLEGETKTFEEKMRGLQDIFAVRDENSAALLYGMSEILKEEKQKVQQHQQLKQQIVQWEIEIQELQLIDSKLEQERDTLWSSADAQTEEQFLMRGQKAEEAHEAQKQLSFLEVQIEVLRTRLVNPSIADIGEDCAALLQEAVKKQQRLHEMQQQLQHEAATCTAEMTALENGSTYRDIVHEWEAKRSQLRELVKKWSAYAVAKAALQNTTARYYKERLPLILKKAERYFTYVTNGQYTRLLTPSAEQALQVERKDGQRFFCHELSQATTEQVYLSLRLALACAYDMQESYPLIIDDSFVHFDAVRTKQTIELIKEIVRERQVIVFTCHPHLLSHFSGDTVIVLKNGAEPA